MRRARTDRATPPGWGVWLLRWGPAGGRAAPRPPGAGAFPSYARHAFPFGEFCLRVPASRP